ncbi:hypothetical protein NP233_g5448 [Leucocoprinus birnbaumii]|uniref:Uncharacterized protein n=1 Tax=Leucocoprinus birnbaumii TaxID=56174 RepID=A0AAD5VSV3_9AGAR|nr:hypothetical protein NP233_g5448 [Leucocoprinus birnbaumii]
MALPRHDSSSSLSLHTISKSPISETHESIYQGDQPPLPCLSSTSAMPPVVASPDSWSVVSLSGSQPNKSISSYSYSASSLLAKEVDLQPWLQGLNQQLLDGIEDIVFSAFSPHPQKAAVIPSQQKATQIIPITPTVSIGPKSLLSESTPARFTPPKWTLSLAFRHFRRLFSKRQASPSQRANIIRSTEYIATMQTLHRIARVRRLSTTLSRLLARKSQVVNQIKKRLLRIGLSGLDGNPKVETMEIALYMGDVQGV